MSDTNQHKLVNSAPEAMSIAITATFTAEPVEASLRFWMQELEIPTNIAFAPYNQVFQQLLDPVSLLAANQKEVNVVLVRLEDWQRDLAESHGNAQGSMDSGHELERNVRESRALQLQRQHATLRLT